MNRVYVTLFVTIAIIFQFAIPTRADNGAVTTTEVATVKWVVDPTWGFCTVLCGGGTQLKTYTCHRISDDALLDDSLCIAQSLPKPSSLSQACNAWTCTPEPTNTFVYNGKRYATLNNSWYYNVNLQGCDNQQSVLPSGWSLASYDANSLYAISIGTWGTVCVVLDTGVSYAVLKYDSICDGKSGNYLKNEDTMYSVTECARRIFIQKPASGVANTPVVEWIKDASYTPCTKVCNGGTKTKKFTCHLIRDGSLLDDSVCTSTPNFIAKPANEVVACNSNACTPQPENTFVYSKTRFATISGAWWYTANPTGCDNSFANVPDGWFLAPRTPITEHVISIGPWGTVCVVLSDGSSWSTLKLNTLCDGRSGNFLVESEGTFRVTECARRILIAQSASTAPDTPVVEWVKDKHYTPCTKVCNGGTKTKKFTCHLIRDGSLLDDSVCTSTPNFLAKPANELVACNSNACTPEPSNTFVYLETRFATISGAWWYTNNVTGCDNSFANIPEGWFLAPPTDVTKYVVSIGPWGTVCVVLSDGSSWSTLKLNTLCDGRSGNFLVESEATFRVTECARRVLIGIQALGVPNTPIAQWIVDPNFTRCTKGCGGGEKRKAHKCFLIYNASLLEDSACINHPNNLPKPADIVIACNTAACPPSPTNFIVHQGTRFATINNSWYQHHNLVGCDNTPAALPLGWAVAPKDDKSIVAVMSGTWATVCLVLADGSSYNTMQGAKFCGDPNGNYLTDTDGLFSVSECARRILISQPATSFDVDGSVQRVNIENGRSVTFNGKTYATLDFAPFREISSVTRCQMQPLPLPTGWSIATYDANTQIAIGAPPITLNTVCAVFADGSSYRSPSFSPSDACGSSMLLSYAGFYTVPCDRRIVISQNTPGVADSWTSKLSDADITNKFRYRMVSYASIDNSAPGGEESQRCQSYPMQIPDGWTIAPNSDPVLAAIGSGILYNTNCAVLADGMTITLGFLGQAPLCVAGNNLIQVGNYYFPKICSTRILIRKDEPSPGYCYSLGDPHFLSFDGALFDNSKVGEYTLIQSSLVSQSLVLQSRQFATGEHSSNAAIALKVGNGVRFGIYTSTGLNKPFIYVDGQPKVLQINDPPTSLEHGGSVSLSGALRIMNGDTYSSSDNDLTYTIIYPNDITLRIVVRASTYNVQYMHVYVWLNPKYFHKVDGLCGNFNNDPTDDVRTVATLNTQTSLFDYFNLQTPDTFINVLHNAKECSFDTLTRVKQEIALAACARSGLQGDAYKGCLVDVGCSGDTSLATMAAASSSDSTVSLSVASPVSACPATASTISNIVSLYQIDYALLDNSNACDGNMGCQGVNNYMRLPSGWFIAPNQSRHRVAVASFPFGTACVVFSDGSGVTEALSYCGGAGMLIQHPSDSQCVSVTACPSRILLYREQPGTQELFSNPDMNSSDGWTPVGDNGYTISTNFDYYPLARTSPAVPNIDGSLRPQGTTAPASRVASSMKVVSTPASMGGAEQEVTLATPISTPLSVTVYSLAEGTLGYASTSYSIYVKATYADGSVLRVVNCFRTGSHNWQPGTVNLYPTAPIAKLYVRLVAGGMSGVMYFDGLTTGPADYEIVNNNSFNVLIGSTKAERFAAYGNGYSVDIGGRPTLAGEQIVPDNERSCMKVTCDNPSVALNARITFGGQQAVNITSSFTVGSWSPATSSPRGILISGWSKSINVSGFRSSHYSVMADVVYTDGTSTFGSFIAFSVGTNDWTREEGLFKLDETKTVARVVVTTRFIGHSGTAYFDDISVRLVPGFADCSKGSVAFTNELRCGITGYAAADPHMKSLDGATFDVMTTGDFLLVKDPNLEIQTRQAAAGPGAVISGFAAIYKTLSGQLVTITILREETNGFTVEPKITIDGTVLDWSGRSFVPLGGDTRGVNGVGIITREGILSRVHTPLSYKIIYPLTGHVIHIVMEVSTFNIQFLNVYVHIPAVSRTLTSGLLGNFNGNSEDDIPSTATTLPVPWGTPTKTSRRLGHEDLHTDNTIVDMSNAVDQFRITSILPKSITVSHRRVLSSQEYFNRVLETTTVRQEDATAACQSHTSSSPVSFFNACVFDVLALNDILYALNYDGFSAASGGITKAVINAADVSTVIPSTILTSGVPLSGSSAIGNDSLAPKGTVTVVPVDPLLIQTSSSGGLNVGVIAGAVVGGIIGVVVIVIGALYVYFRRSAPSRSYSTKSSSAPRRASLTPTTTTSGPPPQVQMVLNSRKPNLARALGQDDDESSSSDDVSDLSSSGLVLNRRSSLPSAASPYKAKKITAKNAKIEKERSKSATRS